MTSVSEGAPPPGYDPSQFPAFAVTVDVVILTMSEGALHVLLVRRGEPPFEGMWAIPGGFKRPPETLDEAANRELADETGVRAASLLRQFGAYGDPGRDPRMNVVTVAYLAVLRDVGAIMAGTDAADASLVPVSSVLDGELELAFDHLQIVRDAVERIRVELDVTGIAMAFVGNDVHAGRAAGGVRGRLGREARRGELPAERRRGGHLGDPDRRASPARPGRRQARRALPRRTGVGPRRPDPSLPARRENASVKAVVYDRYGPPEVLRLEDVERPVPAEDEVLVKIHATSVTRTDTGLRSAEYFISRFFTGWRRPKRKILGMELAGEVAAVGSSVTEFAVGDQVFGVKGSGAHAEFVAVRESAPIAHKPAGMTFEEAAAVCDGAMLALPCLSRADVREGTRLVVYGASGSVGTAAVQLARNIGAEVTAVCNTANVELVGSLGADRVIDYTKTGLHAERRDLRRRLRRGRQALVQAVQALAEAGWDLRLDRPRVHVAPPAAGPADEVDRQQEGGVRDREVHEGGRALPQGADRGGQYRAVIDRRYPLEDVIEATKYVETGQKTGNVVLTLDGAGPAT